METPLESLGRRGEILFLFFLFLGCFTGYNVHLLLQ